MGLNTISVGIDRSSTAQDALRWAVGLADASEATIRAVSTWQMPLIGLVPGEIEGRPTPAVMSEQAALVLDRAVQEAGVNEDVTIEQVLIEGSAGPILVAESATTDLLVVGRTGQGKRHGISRLAEVVLGSTARHCVHHASSPVVTVPADSEWVDPSQVVVGVDGSPSSFAALQWALENLPPTTQIQVARAFAPWVGDGLNPMDLLDNEAVHEPIRLETERWVGTVMEQADRQVETDPMVTVAIGSARDILADPGYAGEPNYRVDMIVVGERGRTGVAARVLGSISDHLVRYASCPVVVVPDTRTDRDE